jgi:predicted RNA binding protein YcfA (HicA-like mRNA interferase family)
MPQLGAVSRTDLISYLRKLGFAGPYSGAKHQFMIKGSRRLRIPNPHQGDIGEGLLRIILRQGGITRTEWEKL